MECKVAVAFMMHFFPLWASMLLNRKPTDLRLNVRDTQKFWYYTLYGGGEKLGNVEGALSHLGT